MSLRPANLDDWIQMSDTEYWHVRWHLSVRACEGGWEPFREDASVLAPISADPLPFEKAINRALFYAPLGA